MREAENPCAGRIGGLAHPGDLIVVQIVDDNGVTGPQHRSQDVGNVGAEAHTICAAIRQR